MESITKILLTTAFSVFVLSACMSGEDGNTSAQAPATTAEVQPSTVASENAPAENATEEAKTEETTGAADAAQQAESIASTFIEGQHYRELNFTLPTEAPEGQIEVTELFWYGCPHCFALEPTIKEYVKNKPDNVYFRRVPATLNPQWAVHAKAYYIEKLLDPDGEKNLHDKIFAAIHTQHRRLQDDASINNFFVSQGFTEEQVSTAANSMEVQMKLKMATEYSTTSQATGVPTLIVNGKYLTSPSMAQGSAKLKRVLKFLVEKSSQ